MNKGLLIGSMGIAVAASAFAAVQKVTDPKPELERSQAGSSEGLFVSPDKVFKPYGNSREGILTFRGNPTRNFYGVGPIPEKLPSVRWVYPKTQSMCSMSYLREKGDLWCGMGWTGQPAVFRDGNRTLLIFGGFDKKVHLMDALTGQDIARPFQTGDIIKGSPTVDPDGYPLVYIGSRDNYMRILSFQGDRLREVWKLNAYAVKPVLWDDDWDASPLVLKDYLMMGGENGHFHVVKLNRKYLSNGSVEVKPILQHNVWGWDQQLLSDFPKPAVSIENSIAVFGNTAFFANSAGLVQGWDLSEILQGRPPKRTFRLWVGDDVDASITIDKKGYLYVASEYELSTARSHEVGQLVKVDPRKQGDNSIIWRRHFRIKKPDGIWSSPALTENLLVVTTDSGHVIGISPDNGKELWKIIYPAQPLWSSPVIIEDRMLIARCDGKIDAYQLAGTSKPSLLWSLRVSAGCFEASPAVFQGKIFIGNRDGKIYGIW